MSFPDAVEDCNKAIAKDPTFIQGTLGKANAQLAMKEYSLRYWNIDRGPWEGPELNGGKNVAEIDQLYNKAASQRFSAIEVKHQSKLWREFQRDPEIVSILQRSSHAKV